ncbi:hypothetical protein O6H91_09G047200 [Diphasiastrum complanatum]|uniref:Uncharacterized protein n=1 Tax=Diphasiastrum complanatum TaxID=34168 RepID=A0ACC2CNS7_DIPCM|nr:hypothetical protein O6H91_09G047200 [Diphasiastrum complanatum]
MLQQIERIGLEMEKQKASNKSLTAPSISADSEYRCHPALRGGQPPLPNKFTASQMESLTAICNTFVPSLHMSASAAPNGTLSTGFGQKEIRKKSSCDEIESFYRLSASDLEVPAQVAAGMLCAWTKPMQFFLVSLVLWLLATRLGTFILCGRASMRRKAPYYLERFAMLPCAQREKVLQSWSKSVFWRLQMLFKLLKCYILFAFYSKVDKNGHNPSWAAIGYTLPHLRADHDRQHKFSTHLQHQNVHHFDQLHNKIINANTATEEMLQMLLHSAGFSVSEDVSRLWKHWINGKSFVDQEKLQGIVIRCDVVVVGSGCGGSVIAALLAQEGYKVVIVEKGDNYNRQDLPLLEGPSMGAMYEQSGALTTEDGGVILLAASTLGGGSEINWSASFRTPPHVLQEWSQKYQLKQFESTEYQMAMDKVCQRLGVQNKVQHESFQNAVLRKGCENLGYDCHNIPRNTSSDHYCGWCCFGCPSGQKQSTTETWLHDAVAANAVILTGCKAEAALLSPNKGPSGKARQAKGVVARAGRSSKMIFIESRATVVACGSLFTPPLLKKSGLKNANIGRNLHLHPVQLVWGYFPEELEPKGKSYEGGIMTAVSRIAADWDKSGYGALLETPSVHPGVFAVATPWCSGLDFKERMRRFPRIAHLISLTRDCGGGTVDASSDGKLIINYTISEKDKESSTQGAVHGLKLLLAAGAEMIGTANIDGEIFIPKDQSDCITDQIDHYLKRVRGGMFKKLSTPLMSAHQMGSCRMGVDAKTSAVDPGGETWEANGLFVGDASVFPSAVGVNPMITVQSVALCIGQSVLRFLQKDI